MPDAPVHALASGEGPRPVETAVSHEGMADRIAHPLVRLFMKVQYHPARCFNRAMYVTGRWRVWDWIDDDVLLGGAPSRTELRRLRDLGIRAIINLCDEFKGYRRELRRYGMAQLWLPAVDHYPVPLEYILRGLDYLRDQIAAGRRIYVHCKAGQGRSTTLALCYLMLRYGLTSREAYRRILRVRPHITKRLYERPAVLELERMIRAGALEGIRGRGVAMSAACP